jgi:hypothetical protein
VTTTLAVSEHPPFDHINLYVPIALKAVIVVVGEVVVVMVAVPGFPVCAVHVPVPVPAIVVELLRGKHVMVSSGPAFGLAVTITAAVSVHPPLVHMKLYVPGALKVVIVVVAEVGVVMVAVPGLPVSAVHVPVPVAAIVAELPTG